MYYTFMISHEKELSREKKICFALQNPAFKRTLKVTLYCTQNKCIFPVFTVVHSAVHIVCVVAKALLIYKWEQCGCINMNFTHSGLVYTFLRSMCYDNTFSLVNTYIMLLYVDGGNNCAGVVLIALKCWWFC